MSQKSLQPPNGNDGFSGDETKSRLQILGKLDNQTPTPSPLMRYAAMIDACDSATEKRALLETCNDWFVTWHGDPAKYLTQIRSSFNSGSEFAIVATILDPFFNDSMSDRDFDIPTICCGSRLKKFKKDRSGRELIGVGTAVSLLRSTGAKPDLDGLFQSPFIEISGLCRAAVHLKHEMQMHRGVKVAREPIHHIKAGFLSQALNEKGKYHSLFDANWAQIAVEDGGEENSDLGPLVDELMEDANKSISSHPQCARLIGLLDAQEMPIRLAEAIVILPYWFLATELLFRDSEFSLMKTVGVFDNFRRYAMFEAPF